MLQTGGIVEAKVVRTFSILLETLPEGLVAVDMPIGLPARGIKGGRDCERAARAAVGRATRLSLFSIPSRSAVHAERNGLVGMQNILAAFARAQAVARRTSEPPTGFSIQAFMIFPKIREIDSLLRANPALVRRVFESHPEVAFWRMNGRRDLEHRKKKNQRVWEPGMEERRRLLVGEGFDPAWMRAELARLRLDRPKDVSFGADDFLDACAMLTVARRIKEQCAGSFPPNPRCDEENLPVAIWV